MSGPDVHTLFDTNISHGYSPPADITRLALSGGDDQTEYEAIIRLARRLCDQPISAITLLDDKTQFIKAVFGANFHNGPRDATICHKIGWSCETDVNGIIEVPDLAGDDRFRDHPLIEKEGLRFYAAASIHDENDVLVGTLCVFDRKPRQLTEEQKRSLADLAACAQKLVRQSLALQQAEERKAMLDGLVDALPEGVAACDAKGGFTLFNSRLRSWHGDATRAAPPDDWARHFNLYAADGDTRLAPEQTPLHRAWRGERVDDTEICIRARDQPPRSVSCNARPFYDSDGTQLGAVVAMHDVTERNTAYRALDSVQRYLRSVIDASTEVAMIATDPDGLITLFNPGAERLLGYTAEEVVGRMTPLPLHIDAEVEEHARVVSAEFGERLVGFAALSARARGPDGCEYRHWTLVHADGSHRQVHLAVNAIRDAEDQIIGYLKVAIDQSRLRDVERALSVSEANFRAAFETAPQGMALLDQNARVIEANLALCEMLGYDRGLVIGRSIHTGTHRDDLAAVQEALASLRDGRSNQYRLFRRMFTAEHTERVVEESTSVIRDTDGLPVNFVVQARDVTEQEELARLKNEFVAVVSHELRTPLTSISGALSLIVGGALGQTPPAITEMLNIASDNASRLGFLINDLLDFEKLEANQLAIEARYCALDDLLADSMSANRGYADQFGVTLRLGPVPAVGLMVDKMRFAQIMANLVSNAVKFSPVDGVVTITSERVDVQHVTVAVTDHGNGIPETFRGHVFEKFAQAGAADTRRQGGTGLGLAITRQLVELMGGRIGFITATGQGTTFHVTMPVATPVHP